MATPTTNYNLLKPATGETYDVNLLDTNYDKIDTQMFVEATAIKKATKILGWDGASATWGSAATPSTSDMDIVVGSQAVTTDSSGYVGINLSGTFPNGFYVVALINGDVAAQLNINCALSTGIFTNTASRFYIRVITANTGASLNSATLRLNYVVIGW